MRALKKFFCVVMICIFGCFAYCVEGSALFSNTHFYLGKRAIEQWLAQTGISLSEDEMRAFLSGLVYADIGRFRFDKESGVESDSEEFAKILLQNAETSVEKWFAIGVFIHVLQDSQTGAFLSAVFEETSGYPRYIMNCSLLDNYFIKKVGSGISNEFLDRFNFEQVSAGMDMKSLSQMLGVPEDKIKPAVINILSKHTANFAATYKLFLPIRLIKMAYQSVNLELSEDDIREQAANAVGSCIITAAFADKSDIPEERVLKIEAKSSELVGLCKSKLDTFSSIITKNDYI